MDFDYSLSFHEGDNFSIEHDNREHIPKNVDADRISENIVYPENVPLQKFYEDTFQKAYEEYIQKQIKNRHADRVRDLPKSYFEYIRQIQIEQEQIKQQMKIEKRHYKDIHKEDKYQRVAKQVIVQVGNIDDFDSLSPQEQQELRSSMKEILTEYMNTFQKENPNFRIVNAVIHCDEVSLSPHLHLTYVPVSYQTRGQTVQNSLSGALKAMGFQTDKEADKDGIWLTAQIKWQKKERDRMVGIAKKHGLSIGYQSGRRIQTKSIQDYQRDRQKERDDALKQREAWVGRKEEELTEYEEVLERRETIVENRNQTIENKRAIVNEQLDKEKERIATEDTKLTERAKGLDAREDELEEREKILQTEAEESVKQVQQAVSAAIDSVKPSPGKQLAEYSTVPLKKGYRAVPEKELEVYIDRSWYRPEYIKKAMQEVVNKFNELPFVKAARNTIFQLENQILHLRKTIQKLKQKNKDQQVLLDKAKEIQLDTMGKTMYDHLVSEVNKDRQKVREMYDHDDDVLGL